MGELTFRHVVSAKDIATVARTAQGIWSEHYENMLGTAQTAYMLQVFQSEGAISRQILSGAFYQLVYLDGELIGYYAIERDPPRLRLGLVYLKREHRGKGYGHRILDEIKTHGEGCSEIVLAINKANAKSIAAYEHLGFERYGERTEDIGAGYATDDYLMRLPL